VSKLIIIFFLFTVSFSFLKNKDIFSPSKIYLFYYFIFFLHSFLPGLPKPVYFLCFLIIFIGFVCALLESKVIKKKILAKHTIDESDKKIPKIIWLFTLIPVCAQIALINSSGGISGFLESYGSRVLAWKGKGIFVILQSTGEVLNLFYFALSLLKPRGRQWWGLFILHTILVLLITGFSGSRTAILGLFAQQMIIFYYLSKINIWKIASVTGLLLFFAMFLGGIREGKIKNLDLSSTENTISEILNLSYFSYGTNPLMLIYNAKNLTLSYGKTFLSILTNLVPRKIWPEKIDSGGVFFTKNYADDMWEGASNLTPTFIGEWIINFGWIFGILGYLLFSTLILFFLVKKYKAFYSKRTQISYNQCLRLVFYLSFSWAFSGLIIGEVTNVTINFVLTKIVPILLLSKALSNLRTNKKIYAY